MPMGPIPGWGGQAGRRGAARGGQPRPLRCGDHPPAATPRIAMETAAAADQSLPAAQPRVPRRGPASLPRRPEAAGRGAQPPDTAVGGQKRSLGAALPGREFLVPFPPCARAKRRAGGGPELGGSKRGRDTHCQPSLAPSLLGGQRGKDGDARRGDSGERMEMRSGRTRGRQMPEQRRSCSSAAALLCPPGSFVPPDLRPPHLPGLPSPAGAPSAGDPQPRRVPPPAGRDCFFVLGYKGKTRAVSPLSPVT